MADPELDEHAQSIATTLQLLMGDLQDHEKRALINAAFPDSFVILIRDDYPVQGRDTELSQVRACLREIETTIGAHMRQIDGSTPFGAALQHAMRADLSIAMRQLTNVARILRLK